MLFVTCTIKVEDRAYKGGVEDAEAYEVSSWASSAPASFNSSNREQIGILVEIATASALERSSQRLDTLKGKSMVTTAASSSRKPAKTKRERPSPPQLGSK